MELDKLKSAWQQQGGDAEYEKQSQMLMDQAILKSRKVNRGASIFFSTVIGVFWGLALYALFDSIINSQYYQLPISILFLVLALQAMWDRKKQKAMLVVDDVSILQQIDNAITLLEGQIRRQRNIIYWFFAPAFLVMGYQVLFGAGKALLTFVVCAIGLCVVYWLTQKEVKYSLEPKLKDLVDLRAELTERS